MMNMKRVLPGILILAMLLAMAGCASPAKPPETGSEPAGERFQADASAGPVSLSALAEKSGAPLPLASDDPVFTSIGDLGRGLLLRAKGDNPVISPLSAWLALAMAAEGAGGETVKEFAALLGGDPEILEKAAAAFDKEFGDGTDEENVFSTANSVWVDHRAEILKSYLDALVSAYGADVYAASLPTAETVKAVNEWVCDKTSGLIPDMLDEPPDPATALILINTLYMKAKWLCSFEKESTYDEEFTPGSGPSVTVPFMHACGHMSYLKGEGYAGIVLPYQNGTANFIALKPDGISAKELLEKLDGKTAASLARSAEERNVSLALPKLDADFTMDMTDDLAELGIPAAFGPSTADFSQMGTGAGGVPLYIGEVLQKVRIIVDEEGTEAAAATMIGMKATGAIDPEPAIELAFNEPFVYLITDGATGAPLFMGIVTNPS